MALFASFFLAMRMGVKTSKAPFPSWTRNRKSPYLGFCVKEDTLQEMCSVSLSRPSPGGPPSCGHVPHGKADPALTLSCMGRGNTPFRLSHPNVSLAVFSRTNDVSHSPRHNEARGADVHTLVGVAPV